jgi:integrase
MAYFTGSRDGAGGSIEPCRPSTLEDVLGVVTRSRALTPRQQQDVASALRTLARLLNRPLGCFPCDLPSVRRLLEGIAPARYGISRRRWANIRSLVFKAIALAGVPRLPGRSAEPLSPEWLRLLAPLPYRPLQVALLPFARSCSRLKIGPDLVDQATFERFARDLEDFSGRSRPREAYLDACRAWNRAVERYRHWPAFRVRVADRRNRYALDWAAFPASLKADIDAMARAAISPDPISATSRRPIRPVSAETRVGMLRAFASALVHQGRDPRSLRGIRELVELDAARLGLAFVYNRAGKTTTPHLHQLAKLLCTVARHWVGVPEAHLQELQSLRKRLDPGRHGMTDKNRTTLRCFEDERLVDRFLSLPARVWRRHRHEPDLKMAEAVALQIAFAIELLTMAPVRCRNLASIRLDQNIIDNGAGRQRRVHLFFPREDVKNEAELEFELPASTIALLDEYLTRVRPVLLRVRSPYLFPGAGSRHKMGALLSKQIADLVEAEVGVRLTAHQFRHLAGFLYLKAHPGGHEVVRSLLGHKSIETTIRFYAGMEAAAAIRHYDRHIARRRAELVRGTKLPKAEGARHG